jgi:hypothetical protein
MTALERRCRWLLHAYPAWYRRQRGEEILATLLEASPPGRSWPSPRDARALLMGGLQIRAWRNHRLTTAASVRQAVMLGAALALLWTISDDLAGESTNFILTWTHITAPHLHIGYWIAVDILALAAVAATWFAPRPAAAALALAAAAAVWQYWGDPIMAIQPGGLLILLAILAPGRNRLPRYWLWLASALSAANLLDQATSISPLLPVYNSINPPLAAVPWIILGAVVLWAAVDARPAVAMAIWIASTWLVFNLLNSLDILLSSSGGTQGLVLSQPSYLSAGGSAVLAAAATWRLRHQAAL